MLKSSKISSLKNTVVVIAQCFFIASLLIFSSDVHAYGENGGSGDIYIRAKTVNILEGREFKERVEIAKTTQSGLTVQVSHPVISAVQTLNALNNNLKDVDDTYKNRMSAVAAGAAALSLKNNYDVYNNSILAGRSDAGIKNAASNSVANASNKMGGLNINVTVGTQSNRSQVTTTESTSRGSSVSASGNAYIQSTAGDITIQGSSIKAGKDLTLDSARDLHILASKDTRETDAKRRNEEGSVGLNFGSRGIGVSFSGGAGRGVGEGEDVYYNQSYVTAGNTLTLISGGDTNIIGGIVSGDKVRAKIGGDLHIESVQDIERSKSRDYGGGATLTIGYGWFSVTGHGNYDAFNNDYKSVKQQSGIFAGDQGFDVTVKGNTNLIGAVIAGSQKSINDGVNQLTTGTLTTSDLHNKAKYDASSTGMSGGYNGSFKVGSDINTPNNTNNGSKIDPSTGTLSPNGTGAANSWNNVSVSRPSVMGANDSSNSTTYSGISGGKITITDSAGQWALTGKTPEQAINEINRGVATGIDQSNALEKIYDEASIKASFNITKQLNTEVGIFQANRAAERAQNEAVIKELDKKGGFENLSPAEQTAYSAAQNALKDSEMWAMGGQGTLILNAISLAANGNVTGSGADLIRDSAVNYLQGLTAQQIKAIADDLQSETARTALHAIAACAGAAAKQGDCGSAALGAGASVVLNNLLDELLKTNSKDMTAAEKDARVNLVTSIIAGITQAAGGDAAMANAGSRIEMENNYLKAEEALEKFGLLFKLKDPKTTEEEKVAISTRLDELNLTDEERKKAFELACAGGANSAACIEKRMEANDAKNKYETGGDYSYPFSQLLSGDYNQLEKELLQNSVENIVRTSGRNVAIDKISQTFGIESNAATKIYNGISTGMTLAEVIATPYFSIYANKWTESASNSPLLSKATQELINEVNKFTSKTQAARTSTMIGAYDPVTGKIAIGSSNGKITANALHPETIAYVEKQLGVKIGEFTDFCKNKAGACAEVSAADQLIRSGTNPENIKFTQAVRPREVLGKPVITPKAIVHTCENCGTIWPNGAVK